MTLGPSSNGAVIDRIGVGNDQVWTLRGPAKRGRSGLHLAEPIVAQRTQHNHSVAERQLGVRDAIAPVLQTAWARKPNASQSQPIMRLASR